MTVGVVITTHNRPTMVVESVQSVLDQVPRPDQVVVVDDGGTTPVSPELQRLAADGAVQFIQQANHGVSAARNVGARHLHTDLVLFLDDDDVLMPNGLDGLRAALAERPDAVAAVGGGNRRHVVEDRLGEVEWPRIGEPTLDALYGGAVPFISAVMIRRAAFDAVGGFEERVKLSEDWDLWLRLARLGPFALPQVHVMEYRVHEQNMSRSSRVARQAIVLGEHYLATLDRTEVRRVGPALATYIVRTYGSDMAWHVRVAFRQARFRDAARDVRALCRLVRLGLRDPESRHALRVAWQQHRNSA